MVGVVIGVVVAVVHVVVVVNPVVDPRNITFNFLIVTIHIINHLDHIFHIEPTDLWGLPQIIASVSMRSALAQYSISGAGWCFRYLDPPKLSFIVT